MARNALVVARDALLAVGCGVAIWLGCDPPTADECEPDEVPCDGACVDTVTDVNHCGGCGNICDEGLTCRASECVAACADDETLCDEGEVSYCANLDEDVDNCGECENACRAGDGCVDGVCVDTTGPTITIMTSDDNLNFGEVATLTFTLSEPSSDFVADDVVITGGAMTVFMSVSETVFEATLNPSHGSTTVDITVPPGAFTDAAGNPSVAAQLTVDQVVG